MPFRRQHEGSDLCAIFVHAGAGYHSVANEKLHLGAVNDAAKVAMAILKNGGDATDAVEMAIRLLEDREITNAGYGSNLTIDGSVECDATMVDHLGRSGAVGSVSQIKNPIALARLVLEASSKPLSLQRVPPNLLVGPGATDFAAEHGVPVLPPDYLISETARSRWLAWREDILNAAQKETGAQVGDIIKTSVRSNQSLSNDNSVCTHTPPVSPDHDINRPAFNSLTAVSTQTRYQEPCPQNVSKHAIDPTTYHDYAKVIPKWTNVNMGPETATQSQLAELRSPTKRPRIDGSDDQFGDLIDAGHAQGYLEHTSLTLSPAQPREDYITDTVGAIAIDCFGRIAAGSSSGGIGMKHRGRCGPAALVGISTAVIPADPDDPTKTCVATVTSGTGEHMATTSAAATAADRIYFSVRRDGHKVRPCDESEALQSMIKNDFMRHPGVRNQPCAGAIGVLAVKKTRDGIYFYFGHNTDSFAIASMHSEERKPVCAMSRNKGSGSIAQGGRVSRSRRAKQ